MIDIANVRTLRAIVGPGVVAAMFFGCALPAPAGAQSLPPQGNRAGVSAPGVAASSDLPSQTAYVLGPDDQISIHVVDVPDISDRPQRIDPNGDLKLPMVGRVHASGMTIDELENALRTQLKTLLQEPDVTVTVGELHSQTVSVIGAVSSPGVHQIRGRQTLIEILSLAGGARPEAGPIVRVMRRPEWGRIPMPEATVDAASGASVVDIDLRSLLSAMAPEKNLPLLPNDVVAVPQAELVYVVGEVGRAGAIPLSRGGGVTVLEAISASGGVLRTGKASGARILRFDAATLTRTEVPIDLQKVMQGKHADMTLLAGDILVVPDATGRRIAGGVLQGFLSAATAAAMYGLF